MPVRAPSICGCGRVSQGGPCPSCAAARSKPYEARRPSARQRGYDSKWDKARAEFLARPENRSCACGCGRKADTVDHIKPHRGDMKLFWDRKNWQALAASPCHSSRKQRQERANG